MKQKVLIPNRGIIALDILHSLRSLGMETVVMYSPEDSLSLPVKMADSSYKFFSSRLEDSYLDMEAIVEQTIAIRADFLHPGYGFLAESPELASLCKKNNIHFIGPSEEILAATADKLSLRETAVKLGIQSVPASPLLLSPVDFDPKKAKAFPLLFKPLRGLGGAGIRFAGNLQEAEEKINLMFRDERNTREGIFYEEFWPSAHQIEIPFFRDSNGNILLLPEVESSIQRRYQKIFQESPSVNIDSVRRDSLYHDTQKLINHIGYVGLGSIEFLLREGKLYFSEVNPTFQINNIMSELHLTQNFLKKQFPISLGEPLHDVSGVQVVEPKHHIMLASLMAEDPYNAFRPSSGTVNHLFHYSVIRNVFKTVLYSGARVSDRYDPYIGKILTYAFRRENTLQDMRTFLDNINIRGIRTNLIFLKHLLECEHLQAGNTVIDFLNVHFKFPVHTRNEEAQTIAASLLSAAFHVDNRRENFKKKLEKMKQPGLIKRMFRS